MRYLVVSFNPVDRNQFIFDLNGMPLCDETSLHAWDYVVDQFAVHQIAQELVFLDRDAFN